MLTEVNKCILCLLHVWFQVLKTASELEEMGLWKLLEKHQLKQNLFLKNRVHKAKQSMLQLKSL